MKPVVAAWVAFAATVAGCGPGPSPHPIVAIGDSITYGKLLDSPATQNYVALAAAQRRLPPPVDLAISGARSDEMTLYELPELDPDASVVVINAGTNDIAQYVPGGRVRFRAVEANLDVLVASVRTRAPRARLVLLTIRDFTRSVPADRAAAPLVARWNAHVRRLAETSHAALVELGSPSRTDAVETADGIHPTLRGSQTIAAWLAPVL